MKTAVPLPSARVISVSGVWGKYSSDKTRYRHSLAFPLPVVP
jgi:hypothetical protein